MVQPEIEMIKENINKLILEYEGYANRCVNLIASENYPSPAVRKALSSTLVGKYAEGYPGKRYYAGNLIVDKIELQIQDLARTAFNTNYYVNVQAHSGSIANQAILDGLLKPSDKILSLKLSHGGHLSHGAPVSITGHSFDVINYEVNSKTGKINYEQVESLAIKHQPKIIICGFTSYPYSVDFARFAKIAKKTNSLLLADISHIVALIISGAHTSPFNYADVVMTTTHKSLCGPRGALIFSKNKEISDAVDKAVFPYIQGGPHLHSIASIGIALQETLKPSFNTYARNIIDNLQAIIAVFDKKKIIHSGSENHLLLLDTKKSFDLTGDKAQEMLEKINILVNKNALHLDVSVLHPSGIRIGTPAMTKRGMKAKQMETIAQTIIECLRQEPKNVNNLSSRVTDLATKFPIH